MERKTSLKATLEWLPYLGSGLLVCLLISMFTGIVIWQESKRYEERAELFTQNAALMLDKHIYGVFDKGDALLQDVAHRYRDEMARGTFEQQGFIAYLSEKLTWFRDFKDIRILDTKGVVRFGTGRFENVYLGDRDYFVRLRDRPSATGGGAMIFSGPLFTRVGKTWVLVLAHRIENPDGSFAGIVIVSWEIDDLSRLFSTIKLGPHGAIVLRTSDMAQVSRYPLMDGPESGIGNRKVSQKLLDLVKTSPAGGFYHAMSPLDKVDRYYSFRKIDEYPLYIIVGEATNDFIATWGLNIYLLLAFSGLMILITVGGSWHIYRLTQQRVRERINKSAGLILEASPVAMMLFNTQSVVTKANPAAEKLFGYEGKSLIGMSVERLQPTFTLQTQAQRAADSFEESTLTREGFYERQDGSHFTALHSISALPDENGQIDHYLETLVDITELKEAQERLKLLAHYDTLTLLPNRGLFFDRVELGLALARRENTQLALLFLDLDKFKPINDAWGHAVGDLVLQEAARRIAACLRESDTVGRVGGDEFLILLLNLQAPPLDAIQVGEKIHQSLNQPFLIEGKVLSISSCIGIALYPKDGINAIELTKNADTAMYHAKATGRDRVVLFDSELQSHLESN